MNPLKVRCRVSSQTQKLYLRTLILLTRLVDATLLMLASRFTVVGMGGGDFTFCVDTYFFASVWH